MAELYHTGEVPQYFCWDRKYYNTIEDALKTLCTSRTIYIGNMSFYTTEVQIHETFSQAGPINRIIMGLNMITKEPCGFCFVEYFTREAAATALNYVNNTICDDRVLRCDLDGGFLPGRQFGRGKSGGQRRDDFRTEYDPGRGDTPQVRAQLTALNRRKGYGGRDHNRDNQRRPHLEVRLTIDPLNSALSAPRRGMESD